jgi:SAM-dependent methyltransferase
MDRFIASFGATKDGDLMLCRHHGVAWQADMGFRVSVPYFEKCGGYEGQEIAQKINAGRIALVDRYASPGRRVLDVGVGSGEFIKSRAETFGIDVDPDAQAWLKAAGKWADDFSAFRAFTFWDVIEHVETPEEYFDRMPAGSYLFTCLPIFDDLARIRESKHYRPGEHLYYWTQAGFIAWMKLHRFAHLATQTFETEAGRDSILSFAFYRVI